MNTLNSAYRFGACALFAISLTALAAEAETPSGTPAGYLPGWQVSVYQAKGVQSQPAGTKLAEFAAPAAGFDLGSYRGAVSTSLAFGLAYDAAGFLKVDAAGRHTLGAMLSWKAADQPGGTQAQCTTRLTLEDKTLIDWSGPVADDKGQRALDANTALEPGLHKIRLFLACDQKLGSRLRVALQIRAPQDSDLQPVAPDAILHPGGGPGAPSPLAAAPPTPLGPPAPVQVQPPPSETARMTLVAVIDLNVREGPDERAPRIGRIVAGQSVEIAGPAEDPAWYRLADGGYAAAAYFKPEGSTGPARPQTAGGHAVPASHSPYKVGDCRPYSMPADLGGRHREEVRGTACLRADGTWHIVR